MSSTEVLLLSALVTKFQAFTVATISIPSRWKGILCSILKTDQVKHSYE